MSEAVDISESPVSLETMMQDGSSPYNWSNTRLKKLCPFCQEPFLMLLESEPSASFSLANSSPSLLRKNLSPQLMESTSGQLSAQPSAALPPQVSAYSDSSNRNAQTSSRVGNTVRSTSPFDLSYSYRDYAVTSSTVVTSGREGLSTLPSPCPTADVSPFVDQSGRPSTKTGREERKITSFANSTDAGMCQDQDRLDHTWQGPAYIADSIAEAMDEMPTQLEQIASLPVDTHPQKSLSQQRHSPQKLLLAVQSDSATLASCSSSISSRSTFDPRPTNGEEMEHATSPLEYHNHHRQRGYINQVGACRERPLFDDPLYQDSVLTGESLESHSHPTAWARGDKSDPISWQLANSDSDRQQCHANSLSFSSGSRIRATEPSSSRSSASRGIMIPNSTRHHADWDEAEAIPFSSGSRVRSTEPSSSRSLMSRGIMIPKNTRRHADRDEADVSPFAMDGNLMSASVPSESKIKSYLFGSRSKPHKEERKSNKKKGHSRSHSMEYGNKKVPPLPPGMIQQHKAHLDSQDSLGKKHGGSQLSVDSAHSDSKNEEEGPSSSGVDRQASSGSSEEKKRSTKSGKRFVRFPVSLRKGSKKSASIVETEAQRPVSPVIPYRDEDPTYLHNNFALYLDMEVFDIDKKEHFELAFKVRVRACCNDLA